MSVRRNHWNGTWKCFWESCMSITSTKELISSVSQYWKIKLGGRLIRTWHWPKIKRNIGLERKRNSKHRFLLIRNESRVSRRLHEFSNSTGEFQQFQQLRLGRLNLIRNFRDLAPAAALRLPLAGTISRRCAGKTEEEVGSRRGFFGQSQI